ncbi:YraN family protein [Acuticoccus sp. MNP-M23]|uniref:YraN family protein n=1 Tax=Acuticoccus sp. MNP-M23 TaxID=3072793 RepID=UPI00281629E3|nr:YraN family protein [Acuticoccus sp. MNP-M23]WMS43258.1 YraN family protein [Acuticoccus sp. MNP-M23]
MKPSLVVSQRCLEKIAMVAQSLAADGALSLCWPAALTRPPARKVASRRSAFRFGIEAERSIRQFLRAGDYTILGTRVLAGRAELDLVVSRGDTVAFVEVKARRHGWGGLESVDTRKIRRITRAANAWLSENERYAGCNIRFDIALVWAGGRVDYMENAFEPLPEDDFVF